MPDSAIGEEMSTTRNKAVSHVPIRVLAANKSDSHQSLITSLRTSIPLASTEIHLVGEVILNLYDTQDWKLSSNGYFVETQSDPHNNIHFVLFSADHPSSHFSIFDYSLFPNAIDLSTVKEVGVQRLLQRLADGRSLVKMVSVSCYITEIEFSRHDTGLKLGKVRLITPKGLPEHWIEIEFAMGVNPTPTLKSIRRSLKACLLSDTNWDRWASPMRSSSRKRFDYNQLGRSTFEGNDSPISALKTIAMNIYQRVKLNSEGVAGDYDLEFCHEIRVDLRKMRVILEHLRHLSPANKDTKLDLCSLTKLEKGLKRFQAICGTQRDLDVFITTLSEVGSDSIGKTMEIKSQREKAHSLLLQFIEGGSLDELLGTWNHSLLCIEQRFDVGVRIQKMSNFAYHRTSSTYKDFMEQAKRTDAVASYEEMHNLRKKGKHLRYTLELFEPTFPPQTFKEAIKELKRTQDLLGAFQDAEVALRLLDNLSSISTAGLLIRERMSDKRETLFGECLTQARQTLSNGGLNTIDSLLKELNKRS